MNNNELESEVAIRVGVKGGGSPGLTYTLDFDSRITKIRSGIRIRGDAHPCRQEKPSLHQRH